MSDELERLRTAVADRYAVVREIGAGGMATVYIADDLKHQRRIALKVLRPELAAVIGAERFLTEIRVTAALQHPNILPLYDSGEAAGLLYYVMPLMEGESLRDRLRTERLLQVDHAIAIIRSVAEALDYAHGRGVIHRDIKPENILLQHGQALVADFGIAITGSIAGAGAITETGIVVGTPYYMSPEQAIGDRGLDARSDIYALGTMLYEMLAGRPPFKAATAQGTIAKIIAEPLPPLRAERPAVPPHVEAAIEVALEKLPADRFPSARAFADALVNPNFTAPRGIRAAVAPPRPVRWTERLALPAIVTAVAALALAGWALTRPRVESPRPVLRYQIALPAPQSLQRRYASRVVLSPDGSQVVFVGPSPQGVQLWVQRRDQLTPTPIPGTEGGAAPFFSPDGRQVGFLNVGRQSLHAVALESGTLTTLVSAGVRRVGAAWGPEGVVYVDDARGLVRVPVTGTGAEPVVLAGFDRIPNPQWPQVLPDGRGVIFTRTSAAGGNELEIAVLSDPDAAPRSLARGNVAFYPPGGPLLYVTPAGELMAVRLDLATLTIAGAPAKVAEGLELQFDAVDVSVSHRGTLAFVRRDDEQDHSEIVWVERDGTTRPVDPQWKGDFRSLAISPDGRQLAVTWLVGGEKMDVWVKPVVGGPAARLTFDNERSYRPTWHPNGRTLGFIMERGDNREFFQRQADGSGGTSLAFSQAVNQAEWSRDGEWLVYRTGRIDDLDVIARRVDGSVTLPIAATPRVNEHSPAISPDGRWVAFVSNRSGGPEVYVRPFADASAGAGEWQVSDSGGSEPRWAHNGRELFFKQGGHFMVADVVTRPSFAVGRRQALFSLEGYYSDVFHPTYDVAPDDLRFAMIRSRFAGDVSQLVVVDGWDAELNARR